MLKRGKDLDGSHAVGAKGLLRELGERSRELSRRLDGLSLRYKAVCKAKIERFLTYTI